MEGHGDGRSGKASGATWEEVFDWSVGLQRENFETRAGGATTIGSANIYRLGAPNDSRVCQWSYNVMAWWISFLIFMR